MPHRTGEARRAYMARWREAHPDYFKQWRQEHADEERKRRRRYRETHRDVMRAQYARRNARRGTVDRSPLPEPYRGHPLFDEARAILDSIGLREHGGYREWSDPIWHDVMGAMVVAHFEGRDLEAAARSTWATERRWRERTIELLLWD